MGVSSAVGEKFTPPRLPLERGGEERDKTLEKYFK